MSDESIYFHDAQWVLSKLTSGYLLNEATSAGGDVSPPARPFWYGGIHLY